MKPVSMYHITITLLFFFFLSLPVSGQSQDSDLPSLFTQEQLAQMLAPVALYPDALLSQVLMASTYPLEVIEADRFVKKNSILMGDSLDEALQTKNWEPGVKSLCHFPKVLSLMSERITETTNIGNAFLAQEGEVMDMIQKLRAEAYKHGSLSTTPEQKVIVEKETIIIEPANPEIIYVPYYNPLYVYGPWWYPNYPPYYWGSSRSIIGASISFWPTPFIGFAIGSWSYFDWGLHYIVIDVHKRPRFYRHDEWRAQPGPWRHAPKHRRGVAYRDTHTAIKFGKHPSRTIEYRREFRGFPERHGTGVQDRVELRSAAIFRKGHLLLELSTAISPARAAAPSRIVPFGAGRELNNAVRQRKRKIAAELSAGAGQTTGFETMPLAGSTMAKRNAVTANAVALAVKNARKTPAGKSQRVMTLTEKNALTGTAEDGNPGVTFPNITHNNEGLKMILRGLCESRAVSFYAGVVAVFIIMAAFVAPAAEIPTSAEKQMAFVSPQEAANALITAVMDKNDAALAAIFGPDSQNLISSGDEVADRNGRARFLKVYSEKHSLVHENDSKAVLYIGNRDYPFPIPIVQRENVWIFDTQAGKEEILNRRIGRNELHVIEALHAYIDAQREYAAMDRNDDGTPEFAQQLISSEEKKDGLYWETQEGEQESPFGPLIAKAVQKGYAGRLATEDPEPYYGYYFKILKAQGEHANGGSFDYVVDGKMILGFALVAYPARYESSGIMTFLVNQEGMIYEKDLDEQTVRAADMTVFDPDDTWKRCKEATED